MLAGKRGQGLLGREDGARGLGGRRMGFGHAEGWPNGAFVGEDKVRLAEGMYLRGSGFEHDFLSVLWRARGHVPRPREYARISLADPSGLAGGGEEVEGILGVVVGIVILEFVVVGRGA